jgi:hypothetical protein
MNFYDQRNQEAVAKLKTLLAKPVAVDDNWDEGDVFDPWSMFPSLYGSYNQAFDNMAIKTLEDIRDGTWNRTDLA